MCMVIILTFCSLFPFLVFFVAEALSLFATTEQQQELQQNASQLGRKYCIANWDGASCWLPTLAGHEAVIPCFSNFNGVDYDSSRKFCTPHLVD